MSGYYPDGVTQDSFDKEFNEMPNEDEEIVNFTLGKAAYDAYFNACSGKSLISGQALPNFEDQRLDIKIAWTRAGEAAAKQWMEDLRVAYD